MTQLSMDATFEIKSRIPIENLVSQYVQLKKVGRSFKGLCPFHKERTPSFYVSPEKQLAYCFGCHKGGDHFKFIEEIEGLDFVGALKFLADKAGVELPKYTSHHTKEEKSQRDTLIALHEAAAVFFENNLWENREGRATIDYIKKRGMDEKFAKAERLGFTGLKPDGLYSFLLGKGFGREEILLSGLALARGIDSRETIDRFRNRLMFPIQNLAGSICAFGGRALAPDDEPKYLNSPETPVFHKSSLLYGLAQARQTIRTEKFAILVEGYMDALAVKSAGFENAVACCGTSLTDTQLAVLKRFTSNVILSFDRDNAGKQATLRAIELCFAQEFSVKVAVWAGDAKDPDDCIRNDKKAYENAIKQAQPSQQYLINSLKEIFDNGESAGKKRITEELMPFFAQTKNSIELDEWIKQCAADLNISISSIYDELKRYQGKQKAPPNNASTDISTKTTMPSAREYLIGMLLTYPVLHGLANQLLAPEDFDENNLQNIYRFITTQYNQALEGLDEDLKGKANILNMFVEMKLADMDEAGVKQEFIQVAHHVLVRKFDAQKRSLLAKIKSSDSACRQSLLDLYQDLLDREKTLIGKLYGKEN